MSACNLHALLFALVLSSLSGCAQRVEWEEEVQLADGRVIRVERMQDWFRSSSVGESERYSPRNSVLRILGEQGRGIPTWSGSREKLLVLDYDEADAELFLISTPTSCGSYKKRGAPKPPYLEYRIRNGRWTRVPFQQGNLGHAANVLVRISRLHQAEHLSPEEVRAANAASAASTQVPKRYGRITEDAELVGCR